MTLDPVIEPLNNHSHPHIFKFTRDPCGHARMFYKNWDRNDWLPNNGARGLKLLELH